MTQTRHVLRVSTSTYSELRGLLEAINKFEPIKPPHGAMPYMPDFAMGEFTIRHKVALDEPGQKSRPLEENL